ncbi:antibiotic biosynthesis monooxygenase family protein [Tenacibaculum agarivorans]|uniref:antibiotic biosynthesis monooxygenase family protein n=1 Tax=Tenacibaculum agarivorans TaxID=1908389 RepID=UPI00094B9C83|nr:antibiotic biosynthesis monooxygenase [Tenacibaculum agarivorans]
MIAEISKSSYYAVIFTTLLTDNTEGYKEMAEKMDELAKQQKGYLGIESARNEVGITISYWESLEAIAAWKNNVEHAYAREQGRKKWYKQYQLRICKVEREYGFTKP